MIQMSREVNKPNSFIAQAQTTSAAQTPKAGLSSSPHFFEQVQMARDAARRRHTNETKIMIDTREKFTRRF